MKSRRIERRLDWDRLEDRICQSTTARPPLEVPSAITNGSLGRVQLLLDEQYQDEMFVYSSAQSIAEGQPVPGPDGSTIPTLHNVASSIQITDQLQQEAATSTASVVFLGDSITWMFANQAGAQVWNQEIAPLNALALGVPGDTTQNLLYRIDTGDLAGHPKVAVVEIGLNNLITPGDFEPVGETVAGVKAVLRAIQTTSPATKILLLGIFPTERPTTWIRGVEYATNQQLASLAGRQSIRFLNPGWDLVGRGGSIAPYEQSDLTHPNAAGFAIVTKAIVPTIRQMVDSGATLANPLLRR